MSEKKKEKIKKEIAFSKLSDKHKLFVKNYVANFGVAYKAYMMTYPNAKYDTARTKGPQLVAKVGIKKAIEEEYKEVYAEIQTETEKAKTYQLIKSIGDTNITDIVDLENRELIVKDLSEIPLEAHHAIESIERIERETKYGVDVQLKVKLVSKTKVLEMRAKIQKLIDPKDDATNIEIIVTPAERPTKED